MDAQGIMKTGARGVTASALLLLALGCANTAPPAGPTVLLAWEGTLAPVFSTDPDGQVPLITGSIAALVRESGTEVGIGLQEFDDPDLRLDWGLYGGHCDSPGTLLGTPQDYITLSADRLEAATVIGEQLAEEGAYHVSVTDADTGTELACGNLSVTDL